MSHIVHSVQSGSLNLPIRLLEYVSETLIPEPSPNCPDMLVSASDLLHIHNLLEMAIDELHRLQDQAVNGEAQP